MNVLTNLISLIEITPKTVTTISNIVLIALIVLVLLGGLIGLIRGVWSSTFRLLFVGTLVVLSYIFAGRIGNYVAEMDLTKYLNTTSFVMDGNVIEITSIKETLIRIIGTYATSSGGSVEKTLNDPQTLALITEIALMVIRLIVFFVLAILILILGNFLATLLYHIIFKHFISKKVRKSVKLRLVGFVEGMVKSILVLSMLVVPFSSILNSVSKSFANSESVQKKELDNETYDQIMEWINAYNDSYFAKALFDWAKDKDGNTLDMKLIDLVTTDDSSTMAFTEELTSILSIGTTLLGTGALTFDSETNSPVIDAAVMLDSEIISLLVAQITTSNLIMNVLPIMASFALNADELSAYLDAEKIDLDQIDWKNDLTTLANVYDDIYKTGIIDEETIQQPAIMVKRILNVEDESVHTGLMNAFERFDDLGLLNQVLPATLYAMSNAKDDEGNYLTPIGEYLPKDWETYTSIKMGKEFSTIYDSIYRLNKNADNALVTYIDDLSVQSGANMRDLIGPRLEEESGEAQNSANQKLINAIMTNAKALLPIIVGAKNDAGEFVGVDENGKLTEGRCLLDSDLITIGFDVIAPNLVTLLVEPLTNALEVEIETEKISEAIESINGRLSIKKEFSALLEIVADIITDENIKECIDNGEIVLTDEVCESLKAPMMKVDDSKILKSTLPQLLKGFINKNSEILDNFGISANSIFYDVDSLGSELVNVLDLVPSIGRLSGIFSGEKPMNQVLNEIEASDITTLLKCVNKSEIFNHDFGNGEKLNFELVVDMLFEKLGYTGDITSDVTIANWTLEIDHIGNFYDSLKEGGFTKLFVSEGETPDYLSRDVLDSEAIVDLFDRIEESALLKVGMGTILDDILSELLSSIDSDKVAFKNIDDWSVEGRNFARLIDNAQSLHKKGIEIENIDFINSNERDDDGNLLTKNLLVSLADSQLFETRSDFGDFLKNRLTGIEGISFADIDDPSKMTKTTQFFAKISSQDDGWDNEIDILFDFISALQYIGENEGLASEKLGDAGLDLVMDNPQNYTKLFVADGTEDLFGIHNLVGINSSTALRMVVANAVKDGATNNASVDGKDFKIEERMNIQALVEMDDASERNVEMTNVCDILLSFKDFDSLTFDEIRTNDENINKLENSLRKLHSSKMFNTLNADADATVFETVVCEFIDSTGINENAILGKVNATMALRNNSYLDVVQTVANNYCVDTALDEWNDQVNELNVVTKRGEISKLFDVVRLAKDVNFANATNDSGWMQQKGSVLLPEINNSKLLYRAIPYFVNEFLKESSTGTFSSHFDLKAGNATYTYDETLQDYEPMSDGTDNTEIQRLCTILDNFKTIKDLMGDGFSIAQIKQGDNRDIIEETLIALSNSEVFHTTGSAVDGKDTVFIQVMHEMFDKASLSDIIYDDTLYHDKYVGISNASENSLAKIKSYDALTKDVYGTKTWEDEINHIMAMFDQVISMDDTNADISQMEDLQINKMSPDQIAATFKVINHSDLCYDAVPKYVKEAFANVDLSTFSENKEDYLMGSGNYRDIYENVEIDVLGRLLNDLATITYTADDKIESVTYIDFGDSGFKVSTFVNNGKSLESIVRFLTNSQIFHNCRGLVLKNSIASVGFAEHISNRYDGLFLDENNNYVAHSNVFDFIFKIIEDSNDETQITREGNALDAIVGNLENVISDSSSGDNKLTSINPDTIKAIYQSCYEMESNERRLALLSSEIVSGFLSDSIAESDYLDDDYLTNLTAWYNGWYQDGSSDFQYPLINDLEANSIAGVISGIKTISDIGSNYESINESTVDAIDAIFATLYDHDTGKNSVIAKYIYEKGIYAKLMNDTNGLFTRVNLVKDIPGVFTNTSAKTQFENSYATMSADNCKDAQRLNFSLETVHHETINIFRAIINRNA